MNVILLGDGNFSFSLALAGLLWSWADDKGRRVALAYLGVQDVSAVGTLYCTSFDSREELLRKYPEYAAIEAKLQKFERVRVRHNVNAWEIAVSFGVDVRFDVIAWNHPHLGVESFKLHRFLMAHFFDSARASLASSSPNAAVIVSLIDGQAERWSLTDQAQDRGFDLAATDAFDENHYPGYICKRNNNAESFKNAHTQERMSSRMLSFTYRYRRRDGPIVAATPQAPDYVNDERQQEEQPELQQAASTTVEPAQQRRPRKKPLDEDKPFKCDVCQRRFTTERGVQGHNYEMHVLQRAGANWTPESELRVACPVCDKRFRDAEAAWQHAVSRHATPLALEEVGELLSGAAHATAKAAAAAADSSADFFPCPVCGQAVPSQWGLEQHQESLKPLVGLYARCRYCEKTFIEHRALMQHANFCRENRAARQFGDLYALWVAERTFQSIVVGWRDRQGRVYGLTSTGNRWRSVGDLSPPERQLLTAWQDAHTRDDNAENDNQT
jgi:hypothetical protein